MSWAFGIDFGTTNSAVVGISGGAHQCFGDGIADSPQPYPSIAAIEIATDRIRTGRSVWEHRAELTEDGRHRVVVSAKQYLATPHEWVTDGRRWTAESVVCEIFKQLQNQVLNTVDKHLDKATICIPVGFTPAKRAALRRAAKQAGIQVTAFISEPTAALLRHVRRLQHCRYAAVFDWGGGTLDVSVISITGNAIRELATASEHNAGDDIDRDIAMAFHARELSQRGESVPFDAVPSRERDLLITQSEQAKRELSQHEEASVSVFSYMGQPMRQRINRSLLNSWIEPRVAAAVDLLKRTIRSVPLSFEAIDELVVTGGSSRLHALRERIAQEFPTAWFSPEPQWDVAYGAAVLDQHPGWYETAEAVGLELCDGEFHPLVPEGCRPMASPRSVSLALVEDTPEANLILKRKTAMSNGVIATLNIPTLGFDRERIDVSCELNEDLILQTTAHSQVLGRTVTTHFDQLRFTYRIDGHAREI